MWDMPRAGRTSCAAVSALVYALIGDLQERGLVRELVIRPGMDALRRGACAAEFALVRCGLGSCRRAMGSLYPWKPRCMGRDLPREGDAMKQLWMDWQLFAEGESAPEGERAKDRIPRLPTPGEDFEALIRGRCKEEFDARVKKILDGRLRGLRQENQRLRQAESARQVQALERLERDAAAVRQMYPAFSPEEELRDEDFCRLIAAGVDARTAYEVRHREELLRQAMRYAAERAAGQAARSIASGGRRVRENRAAAAAFRGRIRVSSRARSWPTSADGCRAARRSDSERFGRKTDKKKGENYGNQSYV